MTREIKYTTDGKKVVVIGSLNSQEKIVQEIFIIDGSEIPSGEHFVVKSLHDAPAISWKEQELVKLNERYEREKKQYESDIDKNYKAYKTKYDELSAKLQYAGAALKNVSEKSFETLVDYITGEIKWIVIEHYNMDLIPIEQFHQMYENKLRLISLFGKDDGTFTYAVGDYYDYSGGNKKFHPFKNYNDALVKLEEILLKKGVSDINLKVANKFGIKYPKEEIIKYKEEKILHYNKNIESNLNRVREWEENIQQIKNITL